MSKPLSRDEAVTAARFIEDYLYTLDRANALKNGSESVQRSPITDMAYALANYVVAADAPVEPEADLPEPNTSADAPTDSWTSLASVLPEDYSFTMTPEEDGYEVMVFNADDRVVAQFYGTSAEAVMSMAWGGMAYGGGA